MKRFAPIGFLFEPYVGVVLLLAVFVSASRGQPQSFARTEVKLLGPLDYGQTSAPAHLAARPPFSAYSFNAKPGDEIEITIQGQGTLQGFLTNSQYQRLAGGSARFSYTFDPASEPGTYYILVSETHHRTSRFTVDLERPSTTAASAADTAAPSNAAAPKYLSCTADTECVAVEKAGCCHNGYKDAVNASQVEAYRAANACKDSHHVCPMFMVVDKRVARCDTALKRCVMIQPEELQP